MKTTIQTYTTDIRGFLEWLSEKQVDFQGELTRFYVDSYREHLLEEQYTINTINKKINSLSSFNQFFVEQGLCQEIVVFPNRDKNKVESGNEEEEEVFLRERGGAAPLLHWAESQRAGKPQAKGREPTH